MIGNDIVDLKLAKTESNWRRKGFLNKIFTASEQKYIADASNSERMVWNLWSRKEAAYKIWNRNTNIRAFNPTQFECFDINKKTGIVKFSNHEYLTKTQNTLQFIYTTAFEKEVDFNKIQNVSGLKVIRENGIPYLGFVGNLDKIISITHHGRFEKIIMF